MAEAVPGTVQAPGWGDLCFTSQLEEGQGQQPTSLCSGGQCLGIFRRIQPAASVMAEETHQARCPNPLEEAEKPATAYWGTNPAPLPSQASLGGMWGCSDVLGTPRSGVRRPVEICNTGQPLPLTGPWVLIWLGAGLRGDPSGDMQCIQIAHTDTATDSLKSHQRWLPSH